MIPDGRERVRAAVSRAAIAAVAACLAMAVAHAVAGGAAYVGAWDDGTPVYVQVDFRDGPAGVGPAVGADAVAHAGSAILRIRSAPRPHDGPPGPWLDAVGTVAWSGDGAAIEAQAPGPHAGEDATLWPSPDAQGGSLRIRLEAAALPDRSGLDPFGAGVLTLRDASGAAPWVARLEAVGTIFASRAGLADGTLDVVRVGPFFYEDPWRTLDLAGRLQGDAGELLGEGIAQRRILPQSVAGFWSDERTAFVISLDEAVVSVLYHTYAFTGGAHPNTWVASEAFVRAGDAWEPAGLCTVLAALDVPCREDVLRTRAIDQLRAAGAAWVVDGEVTADAPWLLETFAVTSGGVRLDYSPYMVGPYVQGPFVAFVPFADLLAR